MKPATKILKVLRDSEAGIGGSELCEKIGMSRAAIWAHIETLRQSGFEIIASPHRGYKLMKSPDLLLTEDLQSRLSTDTIIGRNITVVDSTTSTNDEMDCKARDAESEGSVIFAETQTGGRGRMGRKWSSPKKKGLWLSVLLRPPLAADECTQITIAAAVALVRSLKKINGVKPEIKWPNDILVNGKKISGILTEMSSEPDHVKYVIVGIGVNVNQSPDDIPESIRPIATSLRIVSGKIVDRSQLATDILHELDKSYKKVVAREFPEIGEAWSSYCRTLGKRISIEIGSRKISGCAEALDETGALLVRTEHGRIERIIGGDINPEK